MSNRGIHLKNGVFYMLPVVIGNLLPIITLPIFTRILSVYDYGVFGLCQVYAIFVNGVANFGLTTGYERNFFESNTTRSRAALLYTTILFVIAAQTIFGVLTYCFQDVLANWIVGSSKHGDILLLTFCATAISTIKTYFLTYFKNTENAKSFVWYSIDESVLSVLFSLILVLKMNMGVFGLVFGQFAAGLLVFILLCLKFLKDLPFIIDWASLRSSLKLSLPLTPRIFFGVIGTQFDKYLIGLLSNVGGVGIYNLGQKMGNIVFTFMTAVQNLYSPQVYKRMFELPADKGGLEIGRYLTPYLYISVLGALFVGLFAEEIIKLLTPVAYHGAVNVIMILSLLYATYFFGKQPQLIYAKKTALTSIITLIGIALNIAVNLPFIYYFGVIGAAWGTLIAGLISGSISFYVSQRYYYIKWEYEKVATIFAMLFGFVLLQLLLMSFGTTYMLRFPVKCLAMLSYLCYGYKLSVITKENWGVIRQTVFRVS